MKLFNQLYAVGTLTTILGAIAHSQLGYLGLVMVLIGLGCEIQETVNSYKAFNEREAFKTFIENEATIPPKEEAKEIVWGGTGRNRSKPIHETIKKFPKVRLSFQLINNSDENRERGIATTIQEEQFKKGKYKL